jgi:hypothetical protein
MDGLNILVLVIALASIAIVIYLAQKPVTMKLLPDEQIIVKTRRLIGIGRNTDVSFSREKGSMASHFLNFSGVDVFLTNKRIYSVFLFLIPVLDVPLQNILYFKLIKKWPFVSYICLGYKDNENEKEVLISFWFWKKDADKWNEELQKITASKSYV